MIMYSFLFVVLCSRLSAGREKSKGYSFVVRSVKRDRSRSGRTGSAVSFVEELDDEPAGVERYSSRSRHLDPRRYPWELRRASKSAMELMRR
jgi:hypothetical protein